MELLTFYLFLFKGVRELKVRHGDNHPSVRQFIVMARFIIHAHYRIDFPRQGKNINKINTTPIPIPR